MVEARPVLGQRSVEPELSGLALFPRSPDWTIRRFDDCILTESRERVPSFVFAVLQGQRGQTSSDCSGVPDGASVIHVFHDNYDFHVISLAELTRYVTGSRLFEGKIVILGGAYSSLDLHSTPFGVETGVQLNATAIENALDTNLVNKWSRWISKCCVECFLALVILWVNNRLMPIFAALTTVLGLSVLVSCGAILAFYFADYSVEFVPFIVILWIEQLVEGSLRATDMEPIATTSTP